MAFARKFFTTRYRTVEPGASETGASEPRAPEAGAPERSPERSSDAQVCPGCRTDLPRDAMFCGECGLCMLDVTTEGTVIVRSPVAAPAQVEDDAPAQSDHSAEIELQPGDIELLDSMVADLLAGIDALDDKRTQRLAPVRLAATVSSAVDETVDEAVEIEVRDAAVEIDVRDEEVEIDMRDEEVEIDLRDEEVPDAQAPSGRGPVTPLTLWPAPEPGETVVAATPTPPAT